MSNLWLPDATVVRIKQMYRRILPAFLGNGSSALWNMISKKQENIHNALMVDDDSLSVLLENPAETYLYYGIDNLYPEVLKRADEVSVTLNKTVTDLLVKLADAVGATRYWNPAGGSMFKNREPKEILNNEQLLDAIENVLGAKLRFASPFPGELGLVTGRGRITFRAIQALYQAHRLKTVSMKDSPKCLEIGGGSGRTAYFAKMLGVTNYTIVDLPMTLVAQAAFLSATVGPEAIWLDGEDDIDSTGRIRLVPPSFVEKTNEKYDAVLNVDSFTEMDRAHAQGYVDFAAKHADALISINHEANDFTVGELFSTPACIRSPYWLRAGYIEELYIFR